MIDRVPSIGPKAPSLEPKKAQEGCLYALAKRSFSLQKKEAYLFSASAPITVMHGVSSVGKSSIIAAMRASARELEELGCDLLGYEMALKHIKDHYPETYAFLDLVLISKNNHMHILDAVCARVFSFKSDATAWEKEEAEEKARAISGDVKRAICIPEEAIDHIMLDRALSYAVNKTPVIFDILNVERVFEHALGRMPVRVALVYCPMSTLVTRIQDRNQRALEQQNLSELRLGEDPLRQLGEIFRPKTAPDEPILFSMTRAELVRAFNILFDEWAEVTHANDTPAQKEQKQNTVVRALGFDNPLTEVVHYTPRYKGYDFVIDTSVLDARGAASILVKEIAAERPIETALPDLTGRYYVGLRERERLELVHFDPTTGSERAGVVGLDIYVPMTKEGEALTALFICGKIEAAYTHSRRIKAFERLEDKKPAIIFSPGYQCDPSEYRPLLEQFTSQGFVCIALDHPANSASNRFGPQLDTGKELIAPGLAATEEERFEVRSRMQTEDILEVVRQLKSKEGALQGLCAVVDLDFLILMGHSLGGGASVDAARKDRSVKGVINLDGALRGGRARDPISVPAFTLISGRKYSQPPPVNEIEERIAQENKALKADWEAFSAASILQNPKTKMSAIPEAGHMDFSLAPFLQWRDGLKDSYADALKTHQRTVEEVVFFIESLSD